MNCRDCKTIMTRLDNSITRIYLFCPRCSMFAVKNTMTGIVKFYREAKI